MAPKPWYNEEQRVFLATQMPLFIKRQKTSKLYKFWRPMFEAWFSLFSEEAALGFDLPGTIGARKLTDDELAQLGAAIIKRKSKLENYFRNNCGKLGGPAAKHMKSSNSLARMLFKAKPPRSRAHKAIELFQIRNNARIHEECVREGHDSLNEAAVAKAQGAAWVDEDDAVQVARVKELARARLALRTRVVKALFAQASDEELAAIAQLMEQEKAGDIVGCEEDGDMANRSPAEYQASIDESWLVVKRFLTVLAEMTGWYGFTMWGGPNPSLGGELSMKSFSYGLTPAGNDFEAAHAKFEEGLVLPYQIFLSRCFTPQMRLDRALNLQSGLTPQTQEEATVSPTFRLPNEDKVAQPKPKPKRVRKPKKSVPANTTSAPLPLAAPAPNGTVATPLPASSIPINLEGLIPFDSTPTPIPAPAPAPTPAAPAASIPAPSMPVPMGSTPAYGWDDIPAWTAPPSSSPTGEGDDVFMGAREGTGGLYLNDEMQADVDALREDLGFNQMEMELFLGAHPNESDIPSLPLLPSGNEAPFGSQSPSHSPSALGSVAPLLPPARPAPRGCFAGAAFPPNRELGMFSTNGGGSYADAAAANSLGELDNSAVNAAGGSSLAADSGTATSHREHMALSFEYHTHAGNSPTRKTPTAAPQMRPDLSTPTPALPALPALSGPLPPAAARLLFPQSRPAANMPKSPRAKPPAKAKKAKALKGLTKAAKVAAKRALAAAAAGPGPATINSDAAGSLEASSAVPVLADASNTTPELVYTMGNETRDFNRAVEARQKEREQGGRVGAGTGARTRRTAATWVSNGVVTIPVPKDVPMVRETRTRKRPMQADNTEATLPVKGTRGVKKAAEPALVKQTDGAKRTRGELANSAKYV
ncbi:hypothetical protein C8R47DRAFT_1228420 [Mycena vitilis]|nr:hypothetical protein C8R47DRAFT_1228420 [Mycena vitilis]